MATWCRGIAARDTRARSVADTWVAHRIVKHTTPTHYGSKSTAKTTLGQEYLKLAVLLYELLLILRDIAVDLFQAEYLVFESFDI